MKRLPKSRRASPTTSDMEGKGVRQKAPFTNAFRRGRPISFAAGPVSLLQTALRCGAAKAISGAWTSSRMPRPASAMTLDPLVTRVLAPNPSPFTYTGTQTYLVGTSVLAVIDPGPADPRHLAALVAAIGGRSVAAILCTHTHRDHSPAAALLKAATGAPIIGCAPLTLEDAGPRADAAFDTGYAPDRVLADGESISGPDWTLVAVATPGHTSNHLCFALPESGALFCGDHVMGWSTTVVAPPDGDMAAYMASLDKLMARESDRIYFRRMAS